jgi:hypothetical protein
MLDPNESMNTITRRAPQMPNGEPITIDEVEQLFTANKKEMEQLFATKSDLDQALSATTEEFKKIFATKADLDQSMIGIKGDFEQLLADQANVILEAV